MSEGPGTRSVHGGEKPDPAMGSLVTPIWRTATFRFGTTEDLLAAAKGQRPGFYTRYGHPNFEVVEHKFAALHSTEAAVVFGSGMAAFTGIAMAHLKTGDRVVALRDLYGGTRLALEEFAARFSIRTTFVPFGDMPALEAALPGAKALFAESPTNPTIRVVDCDLVAAAAKRAGALLVFDNTFATPIVQRPLVHGADLVWESGTKALGGHSDLLAGLVAGRADLVEPVRRARRLFGAIPDPDSAWLLARGMKTLAVRVDRMSRTAAEVAKWLERHPAVSRVLYPGLPSHPDHDVARRTMAGGYGGMLTFACRGGLDAARRVADSVRLIANAPSLGGVESLLSLPIYTSHAATPPADRAASGVTDDLVRLSIGLEDASDLIADLDRALSGGR